MQWWSNFTKFQTRFYKDDGSPINHDPDNLIRTQDLEPWYEENSCIYVFDKASFAKTNARIGKKPLLRKKLNQDHKTASEHGRTSLLEFSALPASVAHSAGKR